MATDISKTISLQELYAMLQPYRNATVSLFSHDESTGLLVRFSPKKLRYVNGKFPALIYNGESFFAIQAMSVTVADIKTQAMSFPCLSGHPISSMNLKCIKILKNVS